MARKSNNNNPDDHEVKETATKSAFYADGKFFEFQAVPGIGVAVGSPIPTATGAGTGAHNEYAQDINIAGVASVRYIPLFGIASESTDPVNLASLNLLNKVADALRQRNLPFDNVSLLKFVLSIDSAHIWYRHLYRASNTINVNSITNEYFPQALFQAYHLDHASFLAKKSQMREDLAYYADILNGTWALPKVFNLMQLHEQMETYVYSDSESSKAQFYVCTPAFLWSWETEDEQRVLMKKSIAGTGDISNSTHMLTYDEAIKILKDMINGIALSSDARTIAQMLRTAYENAELTSLPRDACDSTIPFVFDEGFSDCLRNAWLLPVSDVTLTQNGADPVVQTSVEFSGMYATDTTGVYAGSHFINTSEDKPDAKKMTNYMRWRPLVQVSDDGATAAIDSVATEVVVAMDIFTVSKDGTTDRGRFMRYTTYAHEPGEEEVWSRNIVSTFTVRSVNRYTEVGSYGMAFDPLLQLAVLDAFDALPPITYVVREELENVIQFATVPFVHWKFCATYGDGDLRSYHKALLWSALVE